MSEEEKNSIEFISKETNDKRLVWEEKSINHEKIVYESYMSDYNLELQISKDAGVFLWVRTKDDEIKNESIFYPKSAERFGPFELLINNIKGDNFIWPDKEKTIFGHFLDDTARDFVREKTINFLMNDTNVNNDTDIDYPF